MSTLRLFDERVLLAHDYLGHSLFFDLIGFPRIAERFAKRANFIMSQVRR